MTPDTFDAGPLASVTAHSDGDRWTLVFVRELRHPPERVWAALTDPAQLEKWSPFTADRDLGRAGPATLTMLGPGDSETSASSVSRAEAPRVLEYTWGDDRVRWELEAAGSGTRLTLRHTVSGPEMLSKVAAGWHLCLVVAEHLLDGEPVDPIVGEDAYRFGWGELEEGYRGAIAATG